MAVSLGLAVLSLYMLAGTLLAVAARRAGVRSSQDYYVAGYRLGTFLAAMTYAATTYSAFMIVGLVGFAYSTGTGALGFELVYFVGTMLLLSLFAPRVWAMARGRRWISPAEMLGDLYGSKKLAAAVALVYLYALVPYMSAQVKGIAEAVAGLAGSNTAYLYGVALGAAVMIAWTLVAGVWSVAVTDTLQGLWMIASASLLLAWLAGWVAGSIGFDGATRLLGERGLLGLTEFWQPSVFLGFTLPWMFFAATNPQAVQRLFMPRSPRALRGMVVWFAVFGLAYTVAVTLIGLLARSLSEAGLLAPIERRDAVTPTLLAHAPPLLSAMVFTSIVAAAVSTADSIALSVASSVVRDLYAPRARRPSERAEILLGAAVIAALIAAASALALARIGFIVALSVLSSAILLSTAPATILAWAKPELARGRWHAALASIASGAALATAAAIAYGVKALAKPLLLGLPAPFWTLVVSTAVLLALLPLRRETQNKNTRSRRVESVG